MYDKKNNKKIFTTTHVKPREYALPKNIEEYEDVGLRKIAVSETGKFLFCADKDMIRIYNCEKDKPICKYNKKEGDRNSLYHTEPQFV